MIIGNLSDVAVYSSKPRKFTPHETNVHSNNILYGNSNLYSQGVSIIKLFNTSYGGSPINGIFIKSHGGSQNNFVVYHL